MRCDSARSRLQLLFFLRFLKFLFVFCFVQLVLIVFEVRFFAVSLYLVVLPTCETSFGVAGSSSVIFLAQTISSI